MADYSDSRSRFGAVYPDGETESPWDSVEPLITVEQLKGRHLFGIPLVSNLLDPVTGKVAVMTDELLKDLIVGAVQKIEETAHVRLFPAQVKESHAFDKNHFESFMYFRLRQRPIASVEEITIQSSDGITFFTFPTAWIHGGLFNAGQVNIIPLSPGLGAAQLGALQGGGTAGLIHLMLSRLPFIPQYFAVKYTVGFPDGEFPRFVNDLIGKTAAIEILSQLTTTYSKNSVSLGIDAMSQSTSGPGPEIFRSRIKDLQEDVARLTKKLKSKTGQVLFSGEV